MELDKLTLRQRIWEKFWYFKLFYDRAQSYTGIWSGIIQRFVLYTLWIKLWLGYNNTRAIYTLAIIAFSAMVIGGFIDVKYHIINEEVSFINRFNPELKHLVKKAGGNVKK